MYITNCGENTHVNYFQNSLRIVLILLLTHCKYSTGRSTDNNSDWKTIRIKIDQEVQSILNDDYKKFIESSPPAYSPPEDRTQFPVVALLLGIVAFVFLIVPCYVLNCHPALCSRPEFRLADNSGVGSPAAARSSNLDASLPSQIQSEPGLVNNAPVMNTIIRFDPQFLVLENDLPPSYETVVISSYFEHGPNQMMATPPS